MVHWATTRDNEWYNEWQQRTISYNEWQRVVFLANFPCFWIREELSSFWGEPLKPWGGSIELTAETSS